MLTKADERPQSRSAHFLSRFCRCFLALLSKHPKFIFSVLAILFVFCLVVSTVSTHYIDSKTTAFGFRDIGELATQVGYFTNVQIIEDDHKLWGLTLPFTTSKSIFSYDGSIKAGVDFSKIEYHVDTKNKVVSVALPAPAILSVEVDENSLMIYDEKISLFTPFNISDFSEARQKLQETIISDATSNGFLEQAAANAQQLVKTFLSMQFSPNTYTYTFETTQ